MASQSNPRDRAGAAGDETLREAALGRLVEQHARMMFRVAHALLRHPQDAEDAVQDAFVKLCRTGAWQRMEDERAFLARTVWRTAFDRMQKRPADEQDASQLPLRDGRASPEQAAADADEQALLHAWIDDLPEDLRGPLLLSAVQELTSREIALALEIPEGTVRTRLMRARAALRQKFDALNQSRPTLAGEPGSPSAAVAGEMIR